MNFFERIEINRFNFFKCVLGVSGPVCPCKFLVHRILITAEFNVYSSLHRQTDEVSTVNASKIGSVCRFAIGSCSPTWSSFPDVSIRLLALSHSLSPEAIPSDKRDNNMSDTVFRQTCLTLIAHFKFSLFWKW